jgi:hypothetical protein
MSVFNEIEFEYPSADFFQQIESCAEKLPLVSSEYAFDCIKQAGSQLSIQKLSALMARLKKEIADDFTKHENEKEQVPYFVRYNFVVESEEGCQSLNVRTVLQSKHGHSGRILYGTSIYRTDKNTYVSEDSYGD